MINASLQQSIPLGKQYDLIISTQEEFDAFVTSCDDSTCTAETVAILKGNYTASSNVHLPDTVKVIDGINRPTITYSTSTSTANLYFFYYSNLINDTARYRISGIDFDLHLWVSGVGFDGGTANLFLNCPLVSGCYISLERVSGNASSPSVTIGAAQSLVVSCTIELTGIIPFKSPLISGIGVNIVCNRLGNIASKKLLQSAYADASEASVDFNNAIIDNLTVTNLEYSEPATE